ncbi:glycosyltransferase family 2 protein [Sinorhizobium numidicum]|uniref:Glycosyltransferase family 2 protein n=1 Tax=Sinorhizobium numidicum TaxID=680248 RepID=A0ABY8CTR2_9HYPH|nr:glycosyltransferase family 2 protein [Sinorhizobium numidicum]WEX74859.1 glycosyltransferase family 2 protein [Sinorhizobium numidicum]WEX80852.1 glycosyltransferase family 2 protein [Sinorhizobium numidicum]
MIVLFPANGPSSYFSPEDYAYPRPLIEVAGKPMIQWAIENMKSLGAETRFLFVVDQQEAVRYSYERIFDLSTGGRSQMLMLKGPTAGALCTCLMAIDVIDPTEPLVIANSDQIIDIRLSSVIAEFEAAGADAGIITFETIHPRWSYATLGEDGLVNRTSEKEVISNQAIAGCYYFREAQLFFKAAAAALRHGVTVEGRYYVSSSLNEVILDGGRVVSATISADQYHSFYNPKMIENFEVNGVQRLSSTHASRSVQLVVPAAGRGSRFAKVGFQHPKPFIDVLGRPMIQHVLDNALPPGGRPTVLLLRDHLHSQPDAVAELRSRGVGIVPVNRLTEGTACTVLLARQQIDEEGPLLIANSDQVVDMRIGDFIDDCISRGLDGSILVFRDRKRDPKWSFAETDAEGLVLRVAEKQPISDLATVGIYFFRRAGDYMKAALDMMVHNDRTNGEFYVCPTYNYAIRNGARIGVYEIDKSSMHGLGTPEDLAEYLQGREPAYA